MTSRKLTHAMTTSALALGLVAGGAVTTTQSAEAVALLKQPPRGQLTKPVAPGRFRVSQGYHRGHDGIDLAAAKGTPIRAAAGGRVVKVRKWRTSYGKHVVIKHPGGRTISAHMSSIRVKRGQKVRPGQMIGRVGSTGRSTGPHLHFVLKKRGRSVNPTPYLWR